MLLYNNSIISENTFAVAQEPTDFRAEINRSQMDYITSMNAVTKEYFHDLAYAEGEKKIITEAFNTYAAKARALWQRFLAWIRSIFDKWMKFINDATTKPTLSELRQKAETLARTRGADLTGFRFKGAYPIHRAFCKSMELGFETQMKAIRPGLRMVKQYAIGAIRAKDFNSNMIEESMKKSIDQIDKLNDVWRNEKTTSNVIVADILYVTGQLDRMNTMVSEYQRSANAFVMTELDGMYNEFNEPVYEQFPYLQKVLEGLSFAIERHLEEVMTASQRVVADYQKLLGAWYPAASAYLYSR